MKNRCNGRKRRLKRNEPLFFFNTLHTQNVFQMVVTQVLETGDLFAAGAAGRMAWKERRRSHTP
jgi:hypothetical protein